MTCADKSIVVMEKKLAQLQRDLQTPGAANRTTRDQWTTLNTHLMYLKKQTEMDKSITATEEAMKSTLDAADAAEDKSSLYMKWTELNTQLNELVRLKAELAEEEIESKAIDAILKTEVKLY
jgi:hypothetical protein